MLNLIVKLLFFIFHLYSLFVQTVDFLVELVDSFIFESIVAIFCVQLLNQSLELLFLCLNIDGVTFKIVMLLFLELLVKFFIKF